VLHISDTCFEIYYTPLRTVTCYSIVIYELVVIQGKTVLIYFKGVK
jgi:hypothetical protein